MFEIPLFVPFLYAALLVNLIPGTDRIYIVATSLGQGVRRAWYGSLGISTGIFIHSLIGAFGLGALIHRHPFVFDLIRMAGIGLLFYLGIRYWLRRVLPIGEESVTSNPGGTYWQGLLVHSLNPLAILFSFTFIPQFIDSKNDFAWQFLILSASSNVISLAINFVTSYLVYETNERIRISTAKVRIISGLILVGLSLKLFLDWILKSS